MAVWFDYKKKMVLLNVQIVTRVYVNRTSLKSLCKPLGLFQVFFEVGFEVFYEAFEAVCDFFHPLPCVLLDLVGFCHAVDVVVSPAFECFSLFMYKACAYEF